MILLNVALLVLALPVVLATGYLAVLTIFARAGRVPAPPPPGIRFGIVVPAHDEEAGIGETVESLLALDYPAGLRRVIVVADNCTDSTAARAAIAGARVIERVDPSRRGKGFALEYAFGLLLEEGSTDAFVVVDADSLATPNLLSAFSARLADGALAMQARYGVRNPEDSWRTRLMTIALALFHDLRSLGRERLSLSSGLRGNGMCFSARLLREIPHSAHSVVEDVEYGIQLGEAGHRIRYVEEASVLGVMASGAEASRPQRRRWEHGRRDLARSRAMPLLARGIRERNRVLVDLALDLLVPPLSRIVTWSSIGTVAALIAWVWTGSAIALVPWVACDLALLGYVTRGLALSGTGLAGVAALAGAPAYLAWRAAIGLRRTPDARGTWVRTPREEKR